jgi:hypothetical protein
VNEKWDVFVVVNVALSMKMCVVNVKMYGVVKSGCMWLWVYVTFKSMRL